MIKRIIVCCDGTSNTPYRGHHASPLTNVSRMSRYIKPTDEGGILQLVYYQSGLGTAEGSPRLLNQALGIGIDEKIKEAYTFICNNYEEHDEIILIGYSRGAFAVRCLIDLIAKVGLLTKMGLFHLWRVYDMWSRDKVKFDDFDPHRRNDVPIKACVLWDTVNSTGSLKFVHSVGRGRVENCFHALALHEHRKAFLPIVLQKPPGGEGWNLEQCWFVGYHGDIGGGLKDDALAHFALAWVMSRLKSFIDLDFNSFWEHEMGTSSWKLREHSDSRDTFEVERTDSMQGIFRLLGSVHRRPRQQVWDERGFREQGQSLPLVDSYEHIHRSVYQLTIPFGQAELPAVPPCRSLHGVIPLLANTVRTWPLRYHAHQRGWFRGFFDSHSQSQPCDVREARYDDTERVLVTTWLTKALSTLQDNAVESDGDLTTLIPTLQTALGIDEANGGPIIHEEG